MAASRLFACLDQGFYENKKIAALDPVTREVMLKLVLYSSRALTDGFVPKNVAIELANMEPFKELLSSMLGRRPMAKMSKWLSSGAVLDRIWQANGIEVVPGGYQIHDYLDWQQSAEDVRKRREKDTIRQRNFRARLAEKERMSRRDSRVSHDAQIQIKESGDKTQQQATTQSLHAAESFVPAESVSDNLVALHPPATQTDTRGPQLPVTGRMEQPGPDAQPEQKPAMRTTLDARRWKVGGTVESAEDYRAWVSSLGWPQAKTSQKNKDILCSLLKSGPILNADLKAVVTEVMTCTTNPNGGLALSKLRDRLDGRGEATRRRAPGAPTAEDDERNRRNRELAQSVDREENAKRASRFVSQVLTALG
jgi:hypothetical protein